ncbi:DUF4365 domain-containing protein [Flavobacterium sp. P4023]|uniref:DUF4365 domain-containing protein n=1 Tax=Flavobacterium flabelliforme TaxID=2816119 RepID=A0ABS5CTW1_9FLAO|nr:DUF4365 domain-containing protein [Flavobacterium flabelliforme]MBP4142066.1 DUF4365 domain-containing protein [Flavobacterium flabelliforme]
MEHNLNKMSLPKRSKNQNLEVISKRIFEPLFDVEKFILKPENIDNGVDYRCEIIYDDLVTGFGFNFQLKSKEKAKTNKNGTYSKNLETSNIQYLLNNAQPGYYGFYILEEDCFYYECLDDFIVKLNNENPDWEKQSNHTLQFSKKIDANTIKLIYNKALKKGITLRKINSILAVKSGQFNFADKILVDYDGNVTSDSEIRDIIEKFGFELINQSNWNKVIELHKRTSSSLLHSTRYNMIVGLAYYYSGDYLSSLKKLKEAAKEKLDLDLDLQNHLIFITSCVKLLFQMITEEEYKNIISALPPDKHISFHIQIDNAIEILKEKFYRTEKLRIEEFESSLQSIISNPAASLHVKLRAKSELLIYEGKIALVNYRNYLCKINAFEESIGVNMEFRIEVGKEIESQFKTIENQYTILYKEAQEVNNYFAFFYLFSYKQKYDFEKYSTFEILKVVKEPSFNQDLSNNFETIQNNIERCTNYFDSIGHVENILFCQSIKYEILHYQNQNEAAKILLKTMEEKVELLDIKSFRNQVSFIKNGGTNHQMLQNLLNEKIYHPKEETQRMTAELKEFDNIDKDIKLNHTDYHQIELFPMGNFHLPKDKLEEFYRVFNISNSKLKDQFKYMFELGVVPIVNVYVYPVTREGYLRGNIEDKGFESFKNMYNARKIFFENKFYRMKQK